MTLALSRWLGGKRWLTTGYPHMLPIPRRGARGFDVFAGSCVVALHWLSLGVRVVIGDTNPRLIGCLRNLQERPEEVMLRAGFNGLWRENSRGECNTTWGNLHNVNKAGQRQHPRMKDLVCADELRAISALLQRADIRLGDFAATSADARKGDALFADAPYVDPAKGAFVGYSKGGFTLRDRQRLSAWLREMDRRGVRWTATDAATEHTRATYGLWIVDEVDVRRSCSAKAEGRGKALELVIRNWQSKEQKAA